MSKKFITVENGKVQLIHYMPFDAKEGLGKTETEQIAGKTATPRYTEERGFYYEYMDAASSQNMTLVQSVQAGIITPEQFWQITGVLYAG